MSSQETSEQLIEDHDISEQPEYNKKRRSELFQRRSIINSCEKHPVDDNVTENSEGAKEEDLTSSNCTKEPFDLSKHIQILKIEKEMWKKEYKRRKAQRKLLKKQQAIFENGVELDLNILSESEKAFVLARPNYARICRKINELHPIATQIAQQNIEINYRSKTLIDRLEKKIRLITERIAKSSKSNINIIV